MSNGKMFEKSLGFMLLVLLSSTCLSNCYIVTNPASSTSNAIVSSGKSVPGDHPAAKVSTAAIQSNQSLNTSGPENNASEEQNQADLEQYWLNQRDLFFQQTTFNLTKATNALVGDEFANRTYHLPFWFDYEMFKNLTDRAYSEADINLKRHHIYIDNCVHIWKDSALKRLHRPNNFTFIDHAEDWTQNENYNEEWGEISNLTALERRESPVAKALRLAQEELVGCTKRKDRNLCILLLVDLDERFGPSMKLRYPFEEERYRSLLDFDAAEEAAAEFADSLLSADGRYSYWLARRDEFYKNTTFPLSSRVKKLVGPEYANRAYHLPFWFDYEVFKRMVTRINETPQEELKSNHKYIDSCLEIWNDTASDRLGQLDYEAGGITSHVDIPARTCLYSCNPFDYDLTEEELRETPTEKALRLVQEELDQSNDKRRLVLLLVELEERFDFPRAKGMRYPFEVEKSREDFWKYVEDRDKAIADFVKTL